MASLNLIERAKLLNTEFDLSGKDEIQPHHIRNHFHLSRVILHRDPPRRLLAGVEGDGAGGEAGEGVEVAEGEGGGNLDWLLQATLGAEIEEGAGAEEMRVDDEASLRLIPTAISHYGCGCLLSFCRLSVAVAVLVRLGLCLGSAL